jgi:hypothetical protein
MAELEEKITTKTLVEKIPAEKCWKITTNALLNLLFLRGSKSVVPLMGKGEGVFAPVMGWETFKEINTKIFVETWKRFMPWVKETFNIPVEDAIDSAKLGVVVGKLNSGPEWEKEIAEANTERSVSRITKCPWWEKYKELGVKPELTLCEPVCEAFFSEAIEEINPKITSKLTKSMPSSDPYCEWIDEFKEE